MQTYKLYGGAVTLQFDEAKHVYYANGKRAWGVTSATNSIDKSGPLIHWAVVKKCIPFIKDKIKPGVSYDEIQLQNIFTEASYQHNKHKGESADIGTLGHSWVESYVKHKIHLQNPELWKECHEMPPMPHANVLKNLVNAFLEWESNHHVVFHESEKRVYSIKHNYAGTMDIEATVDGELCVVDIKTSNHIVDEYRFQVAAYVNARKEELKKKYKAYWIVRLGKNKRVYENGEETTEFEAIRYPLKTEFRGDFDAFLGSLSVFKRLQELKQNKGAWRNY